MSARMSNNSCAPPGASRNPVITSSKINSTPCSSQSLRIPSRKPLTGGIQPMFPATGSIITAASSPAFALKSSSTLFKSLYRASKVSFAVPWVTPGLFGLPKVTAPLPASIKKESECP